MTTPNKTIVKTFYSLQEQIAMHTLDKLTAHLTGTDVDYLDDVKEIIESFRITLKSDMKEEIQLTESAPAKGKGKGKKAKADKAGSSDEPKVLTPYQQFMRDEMLRLKEEQPDMKGKDRMKEAVKAWNLQKEKNPTPAKPAKAAKPAPAPQQVEESDEEDEDYDE